MKGTANPAAGPAANPRNPERICWGCNRHCPAADLACGEDKARAPHPSELFGDDWRDWAHRDADDRPEPATR